MKPKIEKKISNSGLAKKKQEVLKSSLDDLLSSEPKKLLDIANELHQKIQQEGIRNILERIFDYKKFISGDKPFSYQLASWLDRNTCTYCNRNYTLTIYNEDATKQITRPQFDHYYPQSEYPLLALSIYNLIPSCSICNTVIKRNEDFSKGAYLHPYIKEANESYTFSYEKDKTIDKNRVIITATGPKAKATVDFFQLEDIYSAHANYELQDLIDLRYKYSDNYIEQLLGTFLLEVSKEEAYRLIFGVEYLEEDFHKRPFSKFKRDILEKLDLEI